MSEPTKKCPFCGERIHAEATKCRFCREFLEDDKGLPVSNHARKKLPPRTESDTDTADDKGSQIIVAVPSLLGILGTLLAGLFFFVLGMLLLLWPVKDVLATIKGLSETHRMGIEYGIRYAGLGAIFIVILVMAYKIARIKSIRYEISTDRIEWIRGIFNRKIDNIDMFRVVDIRLHRSLSDVIFGIGTLTLITKDKSDETFDFEKIGNPKKAYDFIKTAALSADRKQGVVHVD